MIAEFRIAVTVEDLDKLLSFYQQGLGLPIVQQWQNEGGRGVVLEIGHATLELLDTPQSEYVDRLEAGKRISGQIRFAVEVENVEATAQKLSELGAEIIHAPVDTPWGDHNQRLQAPDGLQITLFKVPEK